MKLTVIVSRYRWTAHGSQPARLPMSIRSRIAEKKSCESAVGTRTRGRPLRPLCTVCRDFRRMMKLNGTTGFAKALVFHLHPSPPLDYPLSPPSRGADSAGPPKMRLHCVPLVCTRKYLPLDGRSFQTSKGTHARSKLIQLDSVVLRPLLLIHAH